MTKKNKETMISKIKAYFAKIAKLRKQRKCQHWTSKARYNEKTGKTYSICKDCKKTFRK